MSSSAQPQSSSDQGSAACAEEEGHQSLLERHASLRFLLAGGIAGAGVCSNL